MDFNRAQKNFENFVSGAISNEDLNGSHDSSPIRPSSQNSDNDLNDTQVPDLNFSDNEDMDGSEGALKKDGSYYEAKLNTKDVISDDDIVVTQERKIDNADVVGVIDIADESTHEEEVNDNVFINTQIQGRLDDHEKEQNGNNVLKSFNFEYISEESEPIITKTKNSGINKKNSSSATKKSTTKSSNGKVKRAETLLKLLSGKNSKVKSIINRYQNKNKKQARSNDEKYIEETQSTYNSQEWEQVKDILRTKYVNLKFSKDDIEFENVIKELSFEMDEDGDLWSTSQAVMKADTSQVTNTGPIGSLQTLSQVLDNPVINSDIDNDVNKTDQLQSLHFNEDIDLNTKMAVSNEVSIQSKTETSQDTQETEETVISNDHIIDHDQLETDHNFELPAQSDIFTIYQKSNADDSEIIMTIDSSDEYDNVITFNSDKLKKLYTQESPLKVGSNNEDEAFYARPSLRKHIDSIVDISQSSFNAVNSLISPLKTDADSTKQKSNENIISTERSQPVKMLNLNQVPKLLHETVDKSNNIYQFKLKAHVLNEYENSIRNDAKVDIFEKHKTSNYSSEDSSEEASTYLVKVAITDNLELLSSPTNNSTAELSSQNLTELRQKLTDIGLKPARLKSHIVSSLEAASQIKTVNEKMGISSKNETFLHLTNLVEQDSDLLAKIYCFQPISISELISKLKEQDAFVDFIDESTLKEWADLQGICIRSST
ncbi:hypothetical protein RNJ44_00689 [Nakaseomyces bracarensis]|uniref:Structure-specific endonuclease subunit SLX4 n=1 Tax=Nakaseomyces bracarensis TaxID=273131 RepID=A0ABR4NRV2_9SACH